MSEIENASSTVLNNKAGGAPGKQPAATRAAAKAPKSTGKKETSAKNTAGKKQAFMYLGPNVPGGILFTGSVYKELPEQLAGIFEKVPEIKELFVEIKEVPAFKAELERQGSEPFRLRQAIERLIGEGELKNVGI